MSWLSLYDIARLSEGQLLGVTVEQAKAIMIKQVARDSRYVQVGDLFLAIKGERFDGHDFIAELEEKVSAALVERAVESTLPCIQVDDVRLAMGRWARNWRQFFTKPLIALTGSNGKTTLKEMLSRILSEVGSTHATKGNLNNDLGVPLTLFELRPDQHEFAVIEMGANHFGEIAYLTAIAKPDVAILNNAGAAHLEGFGDIQGVSRAKGEIFSGLSEQGIAVINADDTYADYWKSLNTQRRFITFGLKNAADVSGKLQGDGQLQITLNGESILVSMPLLGEHNAMNALAASAAAHAVGLSLAVIKGGLEKLQAVPGRLCPTTMPSGITIIDDTYNANPTSMQAAIDVLASFSGYKVLIVGDMGELGDNAGSLHAAIGKSAQEAGVDKLYGVGPFIAAACNAFQGQSIHSSDMSELLRSLSKEKTFPANTTILVKGSRSAGMERAVRFLTNTEQGGVPC